MLGIKGLRLAVAAMSVMAGLAFSPVSQAASVYSITGDDLGMNVLGSEYIHSRRIGLMPYWGPCERCTTNKINCSIPVSGSGLSSSDNDFINKAYWPDPNASWVYGTAAGCESNVPNGVTSTVVGTYDNTTGSTIDATLYFAADDKGTVSINGNQVGSYNDGGYWGTRAYPATGGVVSDPVALPPGKDQIVFSITNDSALIHGNNGSMGILTIMKNGQVLIDTNKSWSVYPVSQTCRDYAPTSLECSEQENSSNTSKRVSDLDNSVCNGDLATAEHNHPDSVCSCQANSEQPVCVTDYEMCEDKLPGYEQQNPYDYCKCSDTSTTPICESYHDLCEAALPQYQTDTNQCSCATNATSATPQCVSDYDICESKLPQYQNSTNECACYQNSSSTTPNCETDYNICEAKLPQYQNSSNQCSCSDASTTPHCETDYNVCESNISKYQNSDTSCSCSTSSNSTEPTCCTTHNVQQCTTNKNCQSVGDYSCPGYITNSRGQSDPLAYGYCIYNSDQTVDASINSSNEVECPQKSSGIWYVTCEYVGFSNHYRSGTYQGNGQECTQTQTCHSVPTQSCVQE